MKKYIAITTIVERVLLELSETETKFKILAGVIVALYLIHRLPEIIRALAEVLR